MDKECNQFIERNAPLSTYSQIILGNFPYYNIGILVVYICLKTVL